MTVRDRHELMELTKREYVEHYPLIVDMLVEQGYPKEVVESQLKELIADPPEGRGRSQRPEVIALPRLPVGDMPIREQAFIAGLIEGEGTLALILSRHGLVEDYALPPRERIYRYNYLTPEFSLGMSLEARGSVERVARALDIPHIARRREAYFTSTLIIPHVLAIARWARPFLTPEQRRWRQATVILGIKPFREGVAISVTPEEVKEIWGIPTEERYRWLIFHHPEYVGNPQIPEYTITYRKDRREWTEVRRAFTPEDAKYWAGRRAERITAKVVRVEPYLP